MYERASEWPFSGPGITPADRAVRRRSRAGSTGRIGAGRARSHPPDHPRPTEEHPMRFPLRTPVALTALTAGLATLAIAAPALAAPAAVDVGDNFFGTDNVTVNTGEAVTWNWVGSGHNVDFT